jgi:hypothetical protein
MGSKPSLSTLRFFWAQLALIVWHVAQHTPEAYLRQGDNYPKKRLHRTPNSQPF